MQNKGLRRKRYRTQASRYLFIAVGVALAAFGLKGFLVPNDFIDGGVTGLSLLAAHITNIHVSVFLVIFNLPFLLLGAKYMGKQFAVTSFIAIACLAIVILLVKFPTITNDKLLTAIFGGFFIGAGIGLTMRGGSVLDGTEIMAVYITRKSVFSIGDIILVINVLIFIVAAFVLTLESALYSILTYLSAAKTVDFIVQGIEEYTGVTIVSPKSNEIREAITKDLGRGVTIYKGERGFGSTGRRDKELDIIFTVITRLEVSRLKDTVLAIDRKAFMVMNVITDTKGGIVKQRPLH